MYVIDNELPWFTDISKLPENIYLNIIAGDHTSDTNPNGLYSGFISSGDLYTSSWNNETGLFEPYSLPVEDIEKYMFVEYIQDEKPTKPDTPKTTNKTIQDLFKEAMKNKDSGIPLSKQPFIRNPYDNSKPYDYKDFEDAYKKIPRIIFGSKEYKDLENDVRSILKGF